jgi:outer membrane protein TolC
MTIFSSARTQNNSMLLRWVYSIGAVFVLSACSSMSKRDADQVVKLSLPALPIAFEGAVSQDNAMPDAKADNLATVQWWTTFNDPVLTRIVTQTLAQNLSWQAALKRVTQARALSAQTLATQSPQIDLGTGFTRQRRSLETFKLPNTPDQANTFNAPRIELAVGYFWRAETRANRSR